MKVILIFSVIYLLSACAQNQVSVLTTENSVVKRDTKPGFEDRFMNLYPKRPEYPTTCEQNCYPPQQEIECQSPMESCLFTGIQAHPKLTTGFSIQWLGHASFVIKTPDGQQLLLDPVSQQFDWPVNWAFRLSQGFNRVVPEVQLSGEELKKTSAVMYSHIHYDHFNKDDITRIGNQTEFLTPLGFADHFPTGGYSITEMAWYSQKSIGDVNIHFVPAHHFSSRIWVPYLYNDEDKTLWGGWLIEHKGKKIFYAGDTGYSKHFKDINEKYGAIDVCLLPIASYHHEQHSKWYRYVHTTPEDSLHAAQDLNCKVMIPWGYGNSSWKMGDKSSHSALFRLLEMDKQMQNPVPLYILNEGEKISL